MIYKLSEQKLTILKGAGTHSTFNLDTGDFYNSVFYLNKFGYHYINRVVGFRIIKITKTCLK